MKKNIFNHKEQASCIGNINTIKSPETVLMEFIRNIDDLKAKIKKSEDIIDLYRERIDILNNKNNDEYPIHLSFDKSYNVYFEMEILDPIYVRAHLISIVENEIKMHKKIINENKEKLEENVKTLNSIMEIIEEE